MRQSDVEIARRTFRQAFGTFLGAPDPETFAAGRDYVGTRWRADPPAALSAEADGEFAGSNFAAHRGSFATFGPLTVRPPLWNQGIAQHLLAATLDLFSKWGVRDSGLFTFAHSTGHVHLYQKFGFWPRFLTIILSKAVERPQSAGFTKYANLNRTRRAEVLEACRELTDSLYEGLDITGEIRAVQQQRLGDTIVLWDGDRLDAFAVCQCGEGTEGGPGNCYVKFAAVRPGTGAERCFGRLLDACEGFAVEKRLRRMEAGVNLGRSRAYRALLGAGYKAAVHGVAMHRPDSPAYNSPDAFLVDDWR